MAFNSEKYSIKEREKVVGTFLAMSNYTFGISKFKSIPKELFESLGGIAEENGSTKKMFLTLAEGTLPDIFIEGVFTPVTYTKCLWEFTGTCNCPGTNNTAEKCPHSNSECPTGTCTKKVCYQFVELGNGPGAAPPSGNPNPGTEPPPVSTANWSNVNGGPLFNSSTSGLPNAPCGNCVWYAPASEYEFEEYLGNNNLDDVITEFNFEDDHNSADKSIIENGITVEDTQYPQQQEGGKVLGKTTNRQNTEDLTYGTNGNANGLLPFQIDKTDAELFATMTDLFDRCATGQLELVGHDMINKFKINTSTEYTYSDENLNYWVGKSSDLINFIKKFGKLFIPALRRTGNVLAITEIDMGRTRPVFNGTYNKLNGLHILINDTEYTEIKLVSSRNTGNQWEVDVEVTIYDHFGLDKSDALTYQIFHWGFASWWILQHMRNFVPFQTKVVVYKTLKFTL